MIDIPRQTHYSNVNRNRLYGFLARVLEEGTICADSTIELVEKHPARISVLYCNEVYFKNNDAIAMKQIQAVDALAEDWKEKLEKRIQVLQSKVMS